MVENNCHYTQSLQNDLDWLDKIITERTEVKNSELSISYFFPFPKLKAEESEYARFIVENQLDDSARLLLIFCISFTLSPHLIRKWASSKYPINVIQDQKSGVMAPTIETVVHILTRDYLKEKISCTRLFDASHPLIKKNVIELGDVPEFGSSWLRKIKISTSYFELFTQNKYIQPRYSREFPAQLMESEMNWEDLRLATETLAKLEEMKAYLKHKDDVLLDPFVGRHIRPGYRCLFYGPSGTGKTLAANLLGKYIGKEVYRIDLSQIISKYIGETTKNLQRIFDYAEDKDWILFFDEGDAIFGKRVDTSKTDNVNSTYANQDVAYLLQRIERFNGLVIVASNLKNNMDDAFGRRFENAIHFKMPDTEEQVRVWSDFIPKDMPLRGAFSWHDTLTNYPLSIASIVNVVYRLALKGKYNNENYILSEDLLHHIKDEYNK